MPKRLRAYGRERSQVKFTPYAARKRKAATTIQRAWKRRKTARQANAMVIAGNETRTSMFSSPDGFQVAHNNFIELETSLFSLSQDIITNEGGTAYWKKGVIGNRYYCKGVMVEKFQDRPKVTYRFMIVRAAHGNVPNRANLFEGVTGNKMLDYVDTDRFKVEYQKWFTVQMHNFGTSGSHNGVTGIISGTQDRTTRPNKLVKIYWPCKKHIHLQDYSDRETIDCVANRQRQKDFNYHVLLYAYDQYLTLQDVNNIGYVNEYVSKMYTRDY